MSQLNSEAEKRGKFLRSLPFVQFRSSVGGMMPYHMEKMISFTESINLNAYFFRSSVDWMMPYHVEKMICFTESISLSAYFIQKHHHRLIWT